MKLRWQLCESYVDRTYGKVNKSLHSSIGDVSESENGCCVKGGGNHVRCGRRVVSERFTLDSLVQPDLDKQKLWFCSPSPKKLILGSYVDDA